MRPFPEEKLTQIKKDIDHALKMGAAPVAAFDADGTLWHMDMGEHFFQYQIRESLLPDLPPEPWNHYRRMHAEDEPTAFLWLAQINKGRPEEEIRAWAHAAFSDIGETPVFQGVREIIQHLLRSQVEVYVVTASIKWAVEPGAEYLGISRENVIGVQTKIRDGKITDELDGVVTWHEGKVQGLLNATQKRPPFFAAGNTMGDLALLDAATHIRLVNCGSAAGDRIFATEQKLLEVAKQRGWYFHGY